MKSKLLKIALLVLGIILLVGFVITIDMHQIFASIKIVGLNFLLVLIGLTLANVLVKGLRWQLIIRKLTNQRIPLWFSIASIFAGVAGASVIPGRVEFAKPLMLKTEYGVKFSDSLSSLAIERIMDLFGLLLIAGLGMLTLPQQDIVPKSVVMGFVILLVLGTGVVSFFPDFFVKIIAKVLGVIPKREELKNKILGFFSELLLGFRKLKDTFFVLVISVLSLLAHGLEVLRFYLVLQTIGIEASVAVAGFAFAIAIIIGVITMIPGGIGITEISSAGIISTLLPNAVTAVIGSAILIDRFIAYYLLIIVGILVLTSYGWFSKKNQEKVVGRN